jgi:hypothetical protein
LPNNKPAEKPAPETKLDKGELSRNAFLPFPARLDPILFLAFSLFSSGVCYLDIHQCWDSNDELSESKIFTGSQTSPAAVCTRQKTPLAAGNRLIWP